MVRDKAVGVINSYPSVPQVFTGEEIRLLKAISNQAAIDIKRTTLIEKSHELQDALPVLKLIEREKVPDVLEEIDRKRSLQLIQRQRMDFWKSMGELAETGLLGGELDQRVENH